MKQEFEAIQIIHQATSVKKAFLIQHKDGYVLQHYDTIILSLDNSLNIKHVYQCSVSSTRAINQVCDYLGLDKKYVKSCMIPYGDFYKYSIGN